MNHWRSERSHVEGVHAGPIRVPLAEGVMSRVAAILLGTCMASQLAGCGARAPGQDDLPDSVVEETNETGTSTSSDTLVPDNGPEVILEDTKAEVASDSAIVSDTNEDVDDRELPAIFPDEIRALPLAELVWTYRPAPTERTIDPSEGSAVAASDELIVVRTVRRSGAVPTREVTALGPDGHERWSALVPRAIEAVGPVLDHAGATWVFGNEVRDDALTPPRPFAYRVAADGEVLWERALAAAEGDTKAGDVGLRTSALALDAANNAYAVVGHSAVSIGPLGELRWARLLVGGPVEHRCEDVLPSFAPLVWREHVFYADDCSVFIFETDGTVVGTLAPWGGGAPALTSDGWLTRRSGGTFGFIAVDTDGATRASWPLAISGERVFGLDGRMFAYSESGLTAWDGDRAVWSYVGQSSAARTWLTDSNGSLLAVHGGFGELAVSDSSGSVLFDGLVGRATKHESPVSATPGEYVFRSRNFDEGPWVLTCVRLPFGRLPPTWATTNANYQNTRALP